MKKIISMLFCMTNIYCAIENLCDKDLSQNSAHQTQQSYQLYYNNNLFNINNNNLDEMHSYNMNLLNDIVTYYDIINDNLKNLKKKLFQVECAIQAYENKENDLQQDLINPKALEDDKYANQAMQNLQKFIKDAKPEMKLLHQKRDNIKISIDKDIEYLYHIMKNIVENLLKNNLSQDVNTARLSKLI